MVTDDKHIVSKKHVQYMLLALKNFRYRIKENLIRSMFNQIDASKI